MNFNAHVLVAQRIEARTESESQESFDPLVGLGSALPDLSSIAGCRLVHDPQQPSLRRGIALHHATDRAFHDHSWFLDMQGDLYDKLTERGLGRGAARACAHVGIELLIDGYLLRTRPGLSSSVESCFRTIPTIASSLTVLTAEEKQARWRTFLARSADWPTPLAEHYLPAEVAGRLYKILDERRRLRFDESLIGPVSDVLSKVVETLDSGVGPLLEDVTAEVAASNHEGEAAD